MLKRYHPGVEQTLVILPQLGSIVQAISAPYEKDRMARAGPHAGDQLSAALSDRVPSRRRSGARRRTPASRRCARRITAGSRRTFQANAVRGARNMPCMDVPGKRAPTPQECRSNKPYVPLGTNPWFGDPNQILNCPAPGGRCDQAVKPGFVIPGAVGQQRAEPAARRQAAAGRADAAADQRSAAAAGLGFGPVQRTTTQPLHLHSGRASGGRL